MWCSFKWQLVEILLWFIAELPIETEHKGRENSITLAAKRNSSLPLIWYFSSFGVLITMRSVKQYETTTTDLSEFTSFP